METGIQIAAHAVNAPTEALYYRDIVPEIQYAKDEEKFIGAELKVVWKLKALKEQEAAQELNISSDALWVARMLQEVFSVDWSQVKTDGSDGHWKNDIHQQIDAIRTCAESHTLEEMAQARQDPQSGELISAVRRLCGDAMDNESTVAVVDSKEASELRNLMRSLESIYARLIFG